jgi:tetratricopeptide (TPR) repeat protein
VDNFGVLLLLVGAVLALLLLGWFVTYQLRLRDVSDTLLEAEEALDRGEVERARELAAPLLARYPQLPIVQDVSADVLYANGDPLSAASLYERAMKKLGAERVAPKLVAAYAALNRAGDARRVAALAPNDPMTRLALAWSELVAIGGDRERGRVMAEEIALDRSLRSTAAGDAMADVLEAIAAAGAGQTGRARNALDRASTRREELAGHDRAFVGYLGGIALLEMGARRDARETWTTAMDAAPETIGAALARRERSHLPPTDG